MFEYAITILQREIRETEFDLQRTKSYTRKEMEGFRGIILELSAAIKILQKEGEEMSITIMAKCPVCGWKGKTTDGTCPECLGPLIATKAVSKND